MLGSSFLLETICDSSRAFKVSIFHSNISQPTNTHLGYRKSELTKMRRIKYTFYA